MSSIAGSCDPSFEGIVEKLAVSVQEGTFARGVVLEVRLGDDVALSCGIGTDGLHRPVDPQTLFAVYCCTKPVMALAVASLVAQGEISWDDRLGDVLDVEVADGIGERTIEQVMTHTAGFHLLRAENVLPHSPSDRRQMVHSHLPPEGWSPRSHLAYSNFLGWYWLGAAIRAVTGQDPTDYVRASVIEPLGLSGDVYLGFSALDAKAAAGRCGVNVDLSGRAPVPLMLEKVPGFMSDPDLVAAGGYATMSGLCRFYQSLLGVMAGDHDGTAWLSSGLLEEMTTPHVRGRHDLVMGRPGSWGLGFMVDLATHKFGDGPSARSFGHSGNAGSSFAFCDPAHQLSMAVIHTAKVDADISVGGRRSALINSVYTALGLS